MAIHTILIVDDSPTERYYLSEMLVRAGYAVFTAQDGADALAQLKQARPDLILMDVVMPGANGFQITRAIARDPADLLGYVEVHIEQGPVLLERDLPLGIVTAIAGSSRYLVNLGGVASHAGTTPMTMRKDAASAAAEIILLVEQRCSQGEALVGTVGQLHVPNGSVNVIAGACTLSLDIRAASDAVRQAAVDDILDGIAAICARRQIDVEIELLLSARAAPCAPWLMAQLAQAVESVGIEPYALLSGAGHDAMAMAAIT
ncbi:MAG: M20/M25/M40 family metallo-hydrolase, partial [Janthinobacterium sp.]